MSEPSPTEALVRRILDGNAPAALRAAAAKGALPLSRHVLARLQLFLREDPDESVRRDAEQSLAAIPKDALREILADPGSAPELLLHFAAVAARDEGIAEAIAFHPATPDAAIEILAAQGGASVLDLILTNQERLLRSPTLLDRMSENPALRPEQRGRIVDLLARFFDATKKEEGRPRRDAAAPEMSVDDLVDPQVAARILEVDVGELFAASEILGGEEFESAPDPAMRSVYRKILTLSTAQKALLALKGGREERTILIRDTNKVVALSVLKNPRLNEQEVESMAAMRNVSDEVLRAIGSNREWSKTYQVAAALVRNPRTPPGISTNFIPRMTDRDLKFLAKDKNVPEIVRRNAKRIHEQRNAKSAHGTIRKG
mgnify:CR=1 FL=1